MTTPINYTRIIKGMVNLERTYHVADMRPDGSFVVTIYVRTPIQERIANYYEMTHQEEIQQSLLLALKKRYLPKKPKLTPPISAPKKPSAPRPSTSEFTRTDESAYCKECNKFAYKGYRLRSGEFICRDCKNLKSNPNPRPRMVFQNLEGGRRKH